jgi:hypothetical protein
LPWPLETLTCLLPAQGNYPVVREDAAQMCALQVQAEHASTLLDNEDGLLQCIEKYITKQVCATSGGFWQLLTEILCLLHGRTAPSHTQLLCTVWALFGAHVCWNVWISQSGGGACKATPCCISKQV